MPDRYAPHMREYGVPIRRPRWRSRGRRRARSRCRRRRTSRGPGRSRASASARRSSASASARAAARSPTKSLPGSHCRRSRARRPSGGSRRRSRSRRRRPAGAAQDDHLHLRVADRQRHRRLDLVGHRRDDRVEALRPVQRDRRHRSVGAVQDRLVAHAMSRRRSTSAAATMKTAVQASRTRRAPPHGRMSPPVSPPSAVAVWPMVNFEMWPMRSVSGSRTNSQSSPR